MTRDLPVDPDRLRRQFPQLTDADIESYETVTRQILDKKGPAERGRATREILEMGRSARQKAGAGAKLTEAEGLARRYLDAVEKMQGTTVKRT